MTTKHASVLVRRAGTDDAQAIAAVHVAAWQWAYDRLFPDETLRSLSTTQRTARWCEIFEQRHADVWVATNPHVVGFASVARSVGADQIADYDELTAIYLLRSAQGVGVGRALMEQVLQDLRDRRVPGAFLWVADGNMLAKRFYERFGWRDDGTHRAMEIPGGRPIDTVRYVIEL